MTKKKRNALLVVAILLGAGAIAAVMILLRPEEPRERPGSRTPVVGTAEAEAVTGGIPVTGSGTVRAREEVELAPQVGGRIVAVSPSLVSGGRVVRGEVLVRIEQDDYRNAVQQARAQVAQERVSVLQAEEEARIAREEYRQFVQRRADGDSAVADSLARASGLVFREPQLEAARAALARAEAQLQDAELALRRTEVRAPFDAVVRSESVDRGAFASAGTPLATLYASDAVEVVVSLSDEQAALIPRLWDLRGASDSLRIPATVIAPYGRGRYRWEGFVDRAEATVDEQSRTIDVVVQVPDPFRPGSRVTLPDSAPGTGPAPEAAPPLLVGQFAEIEIVGVSGPYVRVPRRALRTDDEVWVVEDGTVRIVPVRVLQRDEGDVVVAGDVVAGARVITEGVDVATEGMEVQVRAGEGS